MPLRISSRKLRDLINPVLESREVPECHLRIKSNTLRVRSTSESKALHLDYSVPLSADEQSVSPLPMDLWLAPSRVDGVLKSSVDSPVSITLPSERPDDRLKLSCEGLTLRCSLLSSDSTHELLDIPTPEPSARARFCLGTVNRSVQAANCLSNTMQVRFPSDSSDVTFATTGVTDGNSFSYSVSPHHRAIFEDDDVCVLIQIDELKDIIESISATARVTLEVTQNYLRLTVDDLSTEGELRLYVAKHITG